MENQTLILSSLILRLLGLIFLLVIIFRLVKKVSKENTVNPLYYIFGFLITSYFYPSGFKGVINIIRNFFLEIYAAINFDGQTRTDQLIGSIFNGDLWYNSITFVCFFLFVAILSSKIAKYLNEIGANENNQVAGINKAIVKNAIVFFVLVFALYFSISSIIAVPVVSYESEDDIQLATDLEQELKTYAKNDSILKAEYIKFIEKKEYLFDRDTVLKEKLSLINDNLLSSKKEINSTFRGLEQLKDRAIARMKITDNSNINAKLRLKDKSELSGWYLENRSILLGYLNKQETAINILTTDVMNSGMNSDFFSFQSALIELAKNAKNKQTKIPPRPTLGSDLGVFTLFTGWLLSVESYPLVIIIGLIGFGLLGAGGSTFIREKNNGEKGVLIDDLAGVLIKGFTAAIVVFLGVQGSLAVLTTNTGNLNAYALFFVSFVAAVFSDDAWSWAKSKFGSEFNPNAPAIPKQEEQEEGEDQGEEEQQPNEENQQEQEEQNTNGEDPELP
ncbi:hypothetical protein [Tenacibaculum agarivorans]|uniref:hypothetical protein n=1 Tax=Tenacibaculum agarivorans TaxID=1908389 RepID=UPI00094BBBFC|nr:hypothetical protein [Tenacibaculum agarivorans]